MGIKVIVVNGLKTAGKTSFANFCKEELGEFCLCSSIINPVKQIAKECGWTGGKTNKDRKFLSDLKDLLEGYNDFCFLKIKKEVELYSAMIKNYDQNEEKFLYIVDMRDIYDIDRAKKELGAQSVLIFNPRVLFEDSKEICHSDKPSTILDYNYDWVIDNSGTFDDLKERTHNFINDLFNGKESGIE